MKRGAEIMRVLIRLYGHLSWSFQTAKKTTVWDNRQR
jgi:hypothetical protein